MTSAVTIEVMQLPHGAGLPLPAYQSALAAGLDLVAAVAADVPLTIDPGRYALVPTGLALALPQGFEAQVRPRSGLAAKHGITLLNSPGTIDADYRGEVGVLLINHGDQPFVVRRGERIAQMVIAPVTQVDLMVVTTLSPTDRVASIDVVRHVARQRRGRRRRRVAANHTGARRTSARLFRSHPSGIGRTCHRAGGAGIFRPGRDPADAHAGAGGGQRSAAAIRDQGAARRVGSLPRAPVRRAAGADRVGRRRHAAADQRRHRAADAGRNACAAAHPCVRNLAAAGTRAADGPRG